MQHPEHNIDFKPAIARYDWDQTYDVLEFVHLPQGFDGLMQSLGIPAFELMAMDRYTPYRYLWAEQYSDYVYHFLKQFNFSPYSSIASRAIHDITIEGSYYQLYDFLPSKIPNYKGLWQSNVTYQEGDIVAYHNGYFIAQREVTEKYFTVGSESNNFVGLDWMPCFLNTSEGYKGLIREVFGGGGAHIALRDDSLTMESFPVYGQDSIYWKWLGETRQGFSHNNRYSPIAKYKVTLTEGSYELTGLVYQGWRGGLTGSIPTINQASYRFTLSEPTDIDLNKIINHWCNDDLEPINDNRFCCNSLVLSKQVGGAWVQQSVSGSANFLFYSDIATYFTEVSEALMQYFADTWDTYKDEGKVLNRILPPQNYYGFSGTATYSQYNTTYAYDIQLQPFPTHLKDYCYLQRANNNRWGGTLYSDLGVTPPIANAFNPSLRGLIGEATLDSNYLYNLEIFSSYHPLSYGLNPNLLLVRNNISISNQYVVPQFPSYYAIVTNYTGWYELGNDIITIDGVTYDTGGFTSSIGAIQEVAFATTREPFYLFAKQATIVATEISVTTETIKTDKNITLDLFSEAIQTQQTAIYGFNDYPTEQGQASGYDYSYFPITTQSTMQYTCFSETEWQQLCFANAVSEQDYLNYLLQTKEQLEGYMVDSVRIKEIHACLGAKEASYYTDSQGNPKEVVMNIARKLDLLCKWQGLNVKLNGEYQRTQSTKYFPPGRPIPPGWYYDRVGVNGGWNDDSEAPKPVGVLGIDDQQVGMAYPVRSNLGLETDDGLNIVKGGAVCCNNILQYIDTALDDLAKALDWEEMGTGAITVGDKVFIYEGMLDILQEILFLVSDNNNNTEESKIAIGVTQQVSKEILKALGLPYGVKTFDYNIDGQGVPDTIEGRPVLKKSVQVPYPGTIYGAPTLVDILLAILANQGVANAGNISLKNEKLQEILRSQQPNTVTD